MKKNYVTSQTLLSKVKDPNDESSWDNFVYYYEAYIYVVIRRMGVQEDLVKDLMQDVLVKIWKSLPNYEYREGECKFRTWLCLLIRRTVYNYFRKKSTLKDNKTDAYEKSVHALNAFTEPEIDQIAELEWKSYVSNMAWENIKDQLSDKSLDIFETFVNGEGSKGLEEKYDMSSSSIRVYRSRVKNMLLKEINRLNRELCE